MNKEIHEQFNRIKLLTDCIAPALQVIPKRELERIQESFRPWANGTMGIVALQQMGVKDLRNSEEILTHAIKVISALIELQGLLIRESVNENSEVVQ